MKTVSSPKNLSLIDDDDIDLKQVALSLRRHWKLISCITLSATIISGIHAFTRKDVWQGQFEIVLEDKNEQIGKFAQIAASNPILSGLGGLNGAKNTLETEVIILESPSVLKPVYNFVRNTKASSGKNVSRWSYQKWIDKSLDIKLVKGTSVLSIVYRDVDKSLVLPVLQKISNTYQEYSNRDKSKALDSGLEFATQQSLVLKANARESSRLLDEYKLTYGINSGGSSDQGSKSSLQLPNSAKGGDPFTELAAINKELTKRLQFFKPSDPSIKRLEQERIAIFKFIQQTGGGLISLSQGNNANENREILLKFKELERKAIQDNSAAIAMDSELLSLRIQKAQQREPWQLISTPTVLDVPVAPNKKKIVAIGLFAGLLFGSGIALILNRRSNLLFNEEEIRSLLPGNMLGHLPGYESELLTETTKLLAHGPLLNYSSIAIIPVGNISESHLSAIKSSLTEALKNKKLIFTRNLVESQQCETLLLVTSQGTCSRRQMHLLLEQLNLQSKPIEGWLLINNTNN